MLTIAKFLKSTICLSTGVVKMAFFDTFMIKRTINEEIIILLLSPIFTCCNNKMIISSLIVLFIIKVCQQNLSFL